MIIINWQPGQLGNCLMLWSHFLAYGIEHDKKIMNPRFLQYASYFEKVDNDFLFLYPAKKSTFLSRNNDYYFRLIPYILKLSTILKLKSLPIVELPDFYKTYFDLEDVTNQDILNKKVVFCNGWRFRAPNLVKKHRKEIIDFFQPKKDYQSSPIAKIADLRTKNKIITGVHIRRGDFKLFMEGRFYFSVAIYAQAMKRFLELNKEENILFVICSNEQIAVNNFAGFDVIINNGNCMEDLSMLSRCDYIIGPPSSFNIWASYYGEVPVYHIEDVDYQFTLKDFRVAYELDIKY